MPDNIAFKCIKSNPIFGSIKTQRRIMSNTPDVDPDKLGVDHNHEQNKIVLLLVLAVVDPSVVHIVAFQLKQLEQTLQAVELPCSARDDALLGAYDAPAVYGDHELPDLSDIVASPSETEPCHPLPCLHIASSREVSMLSTFLPSLVPSPQT
mmetsp:Transcript_8554/g.12419  ORF Transcript_8554/g.12419 Transcript_8554/m.12419 type:complete len:152 (-) Transcript_8554:1279-1734(-)